MRQPIQERDLLISVRDTEMIGAFADLVSAYLADRPGKGFRAENDLAAILRDTQAAAEVLGRRRVNIEAERISGKRIFQDVDNVPFGEAIEAILERSPALARNYQEARERFQEGSFALARSASEIVTRHIRNTISESIRKGQDRVTVVNEISELLGARNFDAPGVSFVKSYSDTVFRTNTAQAYSQGRIRQADDPAVRRVIGGWRYDATNDSNVRKNHLAADGFIAHLDDPVWRKLTPPLGYNCRCALVMVPKSKVVRAGAATPEGSPILKSAPPGAGPDVGFVGVA